MSEMNDQPKHAGCTCMADAYCKVHGNTTEADKPKPAGEWTVEHGHLHDTIIAGDQRIEFPLAFDQTDKLVAIHNAALDAERQRADEAEQGELNEATKLAVERKKVQILEDSVNDFTRSNGALTTEVLQLREQLATITKLEHQLSAAQDALKKILSEIWEISSAAISEDGK